MSLSEKVNPFLCFCFFLFHQKILLFASALEIETKNVIWRARDDIFLHDIFVQLQPHWNHARITCTLHEPLSSEITFSSSDCKSPCIGSLQILSSMIYILAFLLSIGVCIVRICFFGHFSAKY